jgi:hypothetical protein
VWVNGVLSSRAQKPTGARGGRFLARGTIDVEAYHRAFGAPSAEHTPA